MTTTNDGPANKLVKKEKDDQTGESSNLQPAAQEEGAHPSHSFEWCWNKKTPSTLTCNKAGTVISLLNKSSQFRAAAGKLKDKELVIVRDRKAISSHFPCSLIGNKRLTLKLVKAVDKPVKQSSGSVQSGRKRPSSEVVMFHVLVKGGKNVVKITRNPALRTIVHEITVYAYKGEKVKQALKRDGRFLNTIFKKNCVLFDTSTEVNTEMSCLVDDVDGKTFQIILLNKSSPPESQPDSLDDAYMTQSESQRSDNDENQPPSQQSPTTESENDDMPKEKAKHQGNTAQRKALGEVKQDNLSSQSRDLVKAPVSKGPRIQNSLCVEFGQNVQMCREVKMMRKWLELSDSVCHVRINGDAKGSGFLLFGKFVLTNGHVIKEVYHEASRQLHERVTVHFSYESIEQTEGVSQEVEEVVGFEYRPDESPCDWALLRLRDDQKPPGLLTRFGFIPQSGGICIIGHPNGGVKQVDPCLIVPSENRYQVVERHYNKNKGCLQLFTSLEGVVESVQQKKQVLTYNCDSYFGSSGSPVFDKHCKVVAVHSGGYPYPDKRGEVQSVIEFGYPLSDIMERIIIQMVLRGRFDVLKEYLAFNYAQHQNIMTNVKKLVESRNLTAFKNAVNNSGNTDDESLKVFFEFFSQTEEPVLMDID